MEIIKLIIFETMIGLNSSAYFFNLVEKNWQKLALKIIMSILLILGLIINTKYYQLFIILILSLVVSVVFINLNKLINKKQFNKRITNLAHSLDNNHHLKQIFKNFNNAEQKKYGDIVAQATFNEDKINSEVTKLLIKSEKRQNKKD